MLHAAFIVRSTLFTVPGGDTVQINQTARYLREWGMKVDILLTTERIEYGQYDCFHFFNLNRPADILAHLKKIHVPVFISPILVDYSEYDQYHRKGISGSILKMLSAGQKEYAKTISRWLKRGDSLRSTEYIWRGHTKSIKKILERCTALLPNSRMEQEMIHKKYGPQLPCTVIYNGIDHTIFKPEAGEKRVPNRVLCAARIEGIKNQLNLIHALNDTEYTLYLVGAPAPNQRSYFEACKKKAGNNIVFTGPVSQEELAHYYNKASVHVLPSWYETCGLSSLEAAAMGCAVVVTEKGFTREYFADSAFYCDPGSPGSIRKAVETAVKTKANKEFQNKILTSFTWEHAGRKTAEVYRKYIVESK